MSTHKDQTQEHKSQSFLDNKSQVQKNGGSTFNFVDTRSEAITQRKLQEIANNIPRVSQLKAFQDMADKSPQVNHIARLRTTADNYSAQRQQQPIQKKENNTGLPDNLKTGMENLSGMSMDDVKVHHNSDKPAQLQAHAYAQGTDIHLAPGQEKHLPHEAWHVVQQKQGRVKPTMQMKGKVNVNDDDVLEKEADLMGAKALQLKTDDKRNVDNIKEYGSSTIQLAGELGSQQKKQNAANEFTKSREDALYKKRQEERTTEIAKISKDTQDRQDQGYMNERQNSEDIYENPVAGGSDEERMSKAAEIRKQRKTTPEEQSTIHNVPSSKKSLKHEELPHQTSTDMMQPNEALGVGKQEILQETQVISDKDLETQVNQLMKNAATAKDDFIKLIERVIDNSGDKAKNGDPTFGHANKTTEGAIDKAKGRMQGKTTAALNDVLRGAIICDDMETLNKVQEYLDKESLIFFEITKGKTQKKNAFEISDKKSAGDMVGYGDIKYIMPVVHYINKDISNEIDFWMYCEIQVMSNAMKDKKKEGGHSFYDITREAKLDKSSGSDVYKITSNESSKSGANQLLNKYPELLQKGVNIDTLSTLIPKLNSLISGQDIELSDKENNELAFSGELVYRKERLEGNLIAHKK
jgi:hypothetical protein